MSNKNNYPKTRYTGEKPWMNYDWLYNEYIVKDRSTNDIANEYGCCRNTIQCWLSKHKIKKENVKRERKPKHIYETYDYYVLNNLASLWIAKYGTLPQSELLYDPTIHPQYMLTLPEIWILKCKSLPPAELLCPIDYKDDFGYTEAMFWIVNIRTLPPHELLHDPTLKGKNGCTCLMEWIRNNKSIPNELYHDPTLENSFGEICACIWINTFEDLPPRELLEGVDVNKQYGTNKQLLSQYWINSVRHDLPDELIPDPCSTDGDKNTTAMTWIKTHKSLPPKFLLHDPSLKNKWGQTCADIWKSIVNTDVPKELIH